MERTGYQLDYTKGCSIQAEGKEKFRKTIEEMA
jgi:hypothetical protein